MTTEPEFVQETLDWCNEKRKEKGEKALKRLPKGEIGNPVSCPCGAATGLLVSRYSYSLPENRHKTLGVLPASVTEFVFAFDQGNLPQYVLGRK